MSLLSWFKKTRDIETEEQQPKTTVCSADVLTQVVLSAVKKTVHGYNSLDTISDATYASELAEIRRLRVWAMTLSDRRVRNEYFRWLKHFEGGLNEAANGSKKRERDREHHEWQKKNDKLWEDVRDCRISGSVPMPPGRP